MRRLLLVLAVVCLAGCEEPKGRKVTPAEWVCRIAPNTFATVESEPDYRPTPVMATKTDNSTVRLERGSRMLVLKDEGDESDPGRLVSGFARVPKNEWVTVQRWQLMYRPSSRTDGRVPARPSRPAP